MRIIQEIGGSANWPLLTKRNYTEWAFLMKIEMKARDLWGAIEPGSVSVQEDCLALDVITSVVPADMVVSLAVKDTALEACNTVKSMRVGSDAVQKTNAQQLC